MALPFPTPLYTELAAALEWSPRITHWMVATSGQALFGSRNVD
jgi:hypothetical protein